MTNQIDLKKYDNFRQRFVATVSLMSRILGSSLLAGSYVFRFMGLVPTLIVLALTVLMYTFLNDCLINAIYYTQATSFKELVTKLLNSKFAVLVDVSIIFSCVGTLISMQIVSANSAVEIIQKYFQTGLSFNQLKYIIMIGIATVIVIPLCLLKTTN